MGCRKSFPRKKKESKWRKIKAIEFIK